ncbi:MAG: epoxide hydrolase N-terminal domain-containing protein, partial [Spongiibacter sp.]
MNPEKFAINIPQQQLDDLQQRLSLTRFAEDFGNDAWAYGTNGA